MSAVWERLAARLSPTHLADAVIDRLPSLVTAAAVFVVFYLVWMGIARIIEVLRRRSDVDQTLISFIHSIAKYTVLSLGLLTAMSEMGVDVAAIVASLGVVGLTVGFAARDALSNLISGVFIFWDRPFVVGDLVEIGVVYGRVDDITLRSTRVVTPDGKMIAVPNSTIVNSMVASYTNFPHLRLDVPLTVGTGEDLARLRTLFHGVVEGNPAYLTAPAARMVVKAVNDYNLELEFQVWLDDEKQHIAERFALRERLFEALRGAGVDMPLETLQLVQREERHTPAA